MNRKIRKQNMIVHVSALEDVAKDIRQNLNIDPPVYDGKVKKSESRPRNHMYEALRQSCYDGENLTMDDIYDIVNDFLEVEGFPRYDDYKVFRSCIQHLIYGYDRSVNPCLIPLETDDGELLYKVVLPFDSPYNHYAEECENVKNEDDYKLCDIKNCSEHEMECDRISNLLSKCALFEEMFSKYTDYLGLIVRSYDQKNYELANDLEDNVNNILETLKKEFNRIYTM